MRAIPDMHAGDASNLDPSASVPLRLDNASSVDNLV